MDFLLSAKVRRHLLASFINKLKEWGPHEVSGLRDLVARGMTASEPDAWSLLKVNVRKCATLLKIHFHII